MLTLNFSSAIPGTVRDKDNEGTGFTSVQGNKNGTQNAPSLINLDPTTGNLVLTATQGTSAGNTNTLKNALQVGINATQTFTAGTRLIGPLTNLTTASQQGGIFFGSNQDNNVKLVVANSGSGVGGLKIQLYKEENGVTSSPINVATGLNWADIRTLDLYLTGDPVTDTISAAYRINSNDGARVTQNSWKFKVNNPTRFFTNTSSARTGILASTGNAKNVPVTFSSFGIAQNVKINFQPNASVVPAGYLKDSGAAYDAARGYGWVNQSTGAALDISDLARDRNRPNADQRIDTIMHMQFGGRPAAAWEYAVPNGTYNVTVSVGDQANAKGVYDSKNTIRVEGDTVINQFQGSDTQKYQLASATVKVTDGRLTIDALGGTNTKINYLDIVNITPGNHPSIPDSSPRNRTPGVKLDAAVIVDVSLPNVGQGVDAATLNSTNVRLYRTFDNAPVAGNINTSGGGDTIVFQPTQRLQANTNYTFRISEGVRDESGATFQPFSTTFTTGTDFTRQTPGVSFTKRTVYGADANGKINGAPLSSLVISPDGSKLYAASLDGAIRRWNISANGSLTNLQTFKSPALNNRAIIGITFDPNNPNVLWISNNAPIFTEQPAEDFTSKITKLTLGNTGFTATVQDYVVGLPRSTKDHLTESIAFGPDGKLYVSQGSNSAMGALDPTWNRAETLLSGAILQIDPRRTAPKGGFNVQTEAGNSYNPFAANAPVKIYATGVRNAYDLVWHTNGNLYAPTNGSAAGGNTPGDPRTPANEGLQNVATQNDYLFNIKQGGYYGHPNPKRQEYIMNGGNPSAEVDPGEVVKPFPNSPYAGYDVGTPTDPNYRGFAYDFGRNRSPNGVIEYKSRKFNDALRNKLLVVEYSAGDDIIALTPNRNPNLVVNGKPVPVGDVVPGSATKVFSGLKNPLDLIENPKNGNIYVAELPVTNNNTGTFLGSISLLS